MEPDQLPHLIETSRSLDKTAQSAVLTLVEEANSGTPPAPISDQALALVSSSEPTATFIVASNEASQVRGFVIADQRLDPPVVELVVDRNLADPTTWAQALFDELASQVASPALTVWDHGTDSAVGQLANARAWAIERALVIMESPLTSKSPAEPPAGWQLRAFDPATDESGWLELNRSAFVDLPDQSAWTMDDLQARYNEPWFNPAGFLVLADTTGRIRGTHWTKQVGEVGEVYVLAVDPELEGQGIGALLTTAGLNQLTRDGATKVQLYVDASNTKAQNLYRKLGFTDLARDTQYLAVLGHA